MYFTDCEIRKIALNISLQCIFNNVDDFNIQQKYLSEPAAEFLTYNIAVAPRKFFK